MDTTIIVQDQFKGMVGTLIEHHVKRQKCRDHTPGPDGNESNFTLNLIGSGQAVLAKSCQAIAR